MSIRDLLFEAAYRAASSLAPRRALLPPSDVDQRDLAFWISDEELDFQAAVKLVPSVYRAVDLIKNTVAGLPLRFWRGQGSERMELGPEDHELVAAWHAANQRDTGYELQEQIQGSLDINGNAYLAIQRLKGFTISAIELQVLPAHLTKPVLNKDGEIDHYQVTYGLRSYRLPPESVVHWRYFNPDGGSVGLSPLSAAALAFKTQRLSQRWVQQLYLRGGEAAGYFTSERGVAEPQRRRLDLLIKKRYGGPERAGGNIILPPGLKREATMLTPQQLDFVNQYKLTKADVFEVYGIPPWMVGIKEGGGLSDAGARTDERLFWTNTVMPRTERIVAVMNERMLPMFEGMENVEVEFDFSRVTILRLLEMEMAEKAKPVAGRSVMSVNEFRTRYLGMEPRPEPEFDEITPAAPEPGLPAAPGPQTPKPGLPQESMREQLRRLHERQLRRFERSMERAVRRMFDQQERRVTVELEGGRVVAQIPRGLYHETRQWSADDFNEDDADRALIRQTLDAIVAARGAEALSQLVADLDFDMTAAVVQRYLHRQLERVMVGTTTTTRIALRDGAAEVVANGGGLAELSAMVRQVFDDRRSNAVTIARTEVTPAYSFASVEAWEQSEVVEGIEWVAVLDEVTRPAHADADGQVVALGQGFQVGGELLRFPGDPSGSPENVINCRCGLQPVVSQRVRERRLGRLIASPRLAPRLREWLEHANGNGKTD